MNKYYKKNSFFCGKGKTLAFELQCCKRMCINFFGLWFIFASPKKKKLMIEYMWSLLDDLCYMVTGSRY